MEKTVCEFVELLPCWKRSLEDVDENASIVVAYELMRLHGVSVLPVYEMFRLPDLEFKEYVGFITAFDILMHLQMTVSFELDPTVTKISQMHTYKRHCVIISGQESVESLINLFNKSGEHWILVRIAGDSQRSTTETVKLVTQFDVTKHLWERRAHILPVLQMVTAQQLVRLRSQPADRDHNPAKPVTVLPSTHAQVAMKRMLTHKVHAIAVCQESDGKLLADFSSVAVKLAPLQFVMEITDKHILEFLEMLYFCSDDGGGEGEIPEPLICLPSTPLETVLLRLVEYHSHHSKIGDYNHYFYPPHIVWIVNEAEVPVGVLTLTDLLSFLLA